MFITSRISPGELLAHFLDLGASSETDTSQFKECGHNDDLCPRFRRNIDALLTAYESYRTSVHDIQGLADDGVDVLLKYRDLDDQPRRAGIQIKSWSEINAWMRHKAPGGSIIAKLREQYACAVNDAKVDDYYIVLCADAVAHRDGVRRIASAFKNYSNVRVVTPQKALTFYQMSEWQIALATTRLLCADDPLLETARGELARMAGATAYILIRLMCRVMEGDSALSHDQLFSLLDDYTAENNLSNEISATECIENILDELERYSFIEPSADTEAATVNIGNLPPSLCALYFEQKVRHGYRVHDMPEHLWALLQTETRHERMVS